MPRRADPPATQKAKGHPGKRKSQVQKREDEHERVAALLAEAPAGVDGLPKILDQGPLYAGAVAVWKQLAPKLRQTHRLADQHRLTFAIFCCNYADWIRLNEQLLKEGETQRVKTIAGGFMMRDHPAVKRRQEALDNVMKLSAKFGLTPADEYSLFKDQAIAAMTNPGLFGDNAKGSSVGNEKPTASADSEGSAIGSIAALNSDPPRATKH